MKYGPGRAIHSSGTYLFNLEPPNLLVNLFFKIAGLRKLVEAEAMQDPYPELTHRFDDALVYASQLHRNQVKKGTRVPYIAHLLAVTAIVLEHGGSEDEAIAALLHDAVEDQGGTATLEAIRCRFGDNVAAIVEGCSDAITKPKPSWWVRKKRYIAHIPESTRSVRLVSAADKLHNTRAILTDYGQVGEKLWDRFNGKRNGTLWYYRALADAFRQAESTPLTEELHHTVAELERATAIGTCSAELGEASSMAVTG